MNNVQPPSPVKQSGGFCQGRGRQDSAANHDSILPPDQGAEEDEKEIELWAIAMGTAKCTSTPSSSSSVPAIAIGPRPTISFSEVGDPHCPAPDAAPPKQSTSTSTSTSTGTSNTDGTGRRSSSPLLPSFSSRAIFTKMMDYYDIGKPKSWLPGRPSLRRRKSVNVGEIARQGKDFQGGVVVGPGAGAGSVCSFGIWKSHSVVECQAERSPPPPPPPTTATRPSLRSSLSSTSSSSRSISRSRSKWSVRVRVKDKEDDHADRDRDRAGWMEIKMETCVNVHVHEEPKTGAGVGMGMGMGMEPGMRIRIGSVQSDVSEDGKDMGPNLIPIIRYQHRTRKTVVI